MSALAKIKKTAAQHEHDREYDKALAQYARLLDDGAGADEEVDVALYNRAGDLALRAGDVSRAVTYFERAIDVYAAGGFLNNAIALAVKVLRHAPGHLAAHHTLGLLYGRKGFRAEARQHLAAYAAQMHRAGRADEVRRTFGELAALGVAPHDLSAVRELLTARAAGPEEAGELVRLFESTAIADASVGYAGVQAPAGTADGSGSFSELLELEVRRAESTRIAAHTSTVPRWMTALPGEPAPLLLSRLRAPAADTAVELLDLGPVTFDATPFVLQEPSTDVMMLDTLDLTSDLTKRDLTPDDLVLSDVARAANDDGAGRGVLEFVEVSEVDDFGLQLTAPEFEFLTEPVDVAEPATLPATFDLDAFVPEQAAGRAVDAPPVVLDLDHPDDALLDLGAWLRSTELPTSTRLVTPAAPESGDEDADFDAALHAFTAGIARSVDAGDRESHYDLGIAFREMGLLTDAVRELQRALAAPGGGLREREALAQTFLELGRPELALATLEQAAGAAAAAGESAEALIGVRYVLAESARAVGRHADARTWYVSVLAADYGFRNAADRLAALPPPATVAA